MRQDYWNAAYSDQGLVYRDGKTLMPRRAAPTPEQIQWGKRILLVTERNGGKHVLGEMHTGRGRLDSGETFDFSYAVPLNQKDQRGCRRFLAADGQHRGINKVTFESSQVPYRPRGKPAESVIFSKDGGFMIKRKF